MCLIHDDKICIFLMANTPKRAKGQNYCQSFMTNSQKATTFNFMLLQYHRGHRGMPYHYQGPNITAGIKCFEACVACFGASRFLWRENSNIA